MRDRIHTVLLQVYKRLPRPLRVWVAHLLSTSFTCGTMCLVERDDGAVLLVRHLYKQRWGLPGGFLKRGEEAADGARRETMEEVGLAVDPVGEPAVVVTPGPRRVDVVFACRVSPGADPDAVSPRSPELVDARWYPAVALPPLEPDAAAALDALQRARADRRPA